jgi:hypothetical protein
MNEEIKNLVDSFLAANLSVDEIHEHLKDQDVKIHKSILKSYCEKRDKSEIDLDCIKIEKNTPTYVYMIRAQNTLAQIVLAKLNQYANGINDLPASDISSLNTLTTIVKNSNHIREYTQQYEGKKSF